MSPILTDQFFGFDHYIHQPYAPTHTPEVDHHQVHEPQLVEVTGEWCPMNHWRVVIAVA
jgi:hypothetical protein